MFNNKFVWHYTKFIASYSSQRSVHAFVQEKLIGYLNNRNYKTEIGGKNIKSIKVIADNPQRSDTNKQGSGFYESYLGSGNAQEALPKTHFFKFIYFNKIKKKNPLNVFIKLFLKFLTCFQYFFNNFKDF